MSLAAAPRTVRLGPSLIAAALAALCADLLLTLRLRGLLRRRWQRCSSRWRQRRMRPPRIAPRWRPTWAYVVTGDAAVDGTSKAGLSGLSDYVNDHTAAVLASPAGVTPAGTI
ncbi:MAG: hypothetical protein WDN04_07075 [Rhodospirillales bacterium]